MRRFFLFLTALSCLVMISGFYCTGAFAEELTARKTDDIKKLLLMTGGVKIGRQMSDTMVGLLTSTVKASRPDIPQEAFEIIKDEVNKAFTESLDKKGGLMDQLVVLYGKYYTDDEVKELIAFYQTKLGQKIVAVTPDISSESMLIGLNWGQALFPEVSQKIEKRLKDKGINIPLK